jgi:hypothetical protein
LIKAEECFVPGKEQMENKRGLQAQTWRSCNPVVLLGGCVSDWISIISLVEEFEFWTMFCLQFQVSHRKPSTNETLNKVSEECSIENPCIIHTFCIKIQKKTHISNRRPTSCNDPKFQLFSENKYSRKCVYGKRRDHMGINAESGLIKH